MKEKLPFREGTTHITYLHTDDDHRHKSRCIHLNADGTCGIIVYKCTGSAHCEYYKENNTNSTVEIKHTIKTSNQTKNMDFVGCKQIHFSDFDHEKYEKSDRTQLTILVDRLLSKRMELLDALNTPIEVEINEKGTKYRCYDYQSYVKVCAAKKVGKTSILSKMNMPQNQQPENNIVYFTKSAPLNMKFRGNKKISVSEIHVSDYYKRHKKHCEDWRRENLSLFDSSKWWEEPVKIHILNGAYYIKDKDIASYEKYRYALVHKHKTLLVRLV